MFFFFCHSFYPCCWILSIVIAAVSDKMHKIGLEIGAMSCTHENEEIYRENNTTVNPFVSTFWMLCSALNYSFSIELAIHCAKDQFICIVHFNYMLHTFHQLLQNWLSAHWQKIPLLFTLSSIFSVVIPIFGQFSLLKTNANHCVCERAHASWQLNYQAMTTGTI